MIPMLKKEFKSKRISLLAYSFSVIVLTWMYTALYPTIQQQSAVLTKTLESFGGAIKAFGIQDIGFDTIEKYLATELFGITWPVLVITFVAARAGQSIAGETEKGTMGLLLSLPVSRLKIYAAKYLAGLLGILIFVLVTVFATPPIASLYGIDYQVENFTTLSLICFLFGWCIYSFGMFLSSIFSEKGHVYVALGGTLMIMYVVNVLAILSDTLDWLKYSSVFHYLTASEALISNHIVASSVVVFVASITMFTVGGAAWFVKRDVVV